MGTLSQLFWGKKRIFRRICLRFYRPTVLPPGSGTSLRREWAASVAFLDESSRQVLLLRPCNDWEFGTHPFVVRVWCSYYIAPWIIYWLCSAFIRYLDVLIAVGDCRRRLSEVWTCLQCKFFFSTRQTCIHIYLCYMVADENNYTYVTVRLYVDNSRKWFYLFMLGLELLKKLPISQS